MTQLSSALPVAPDFGQAPPAPSAARRAWAVVWPRVVQLAVLLWAISTILFILLRASGNPAVVLAGEDASPEMIAQIEAQYGLDRPVIIQYLIFIGGILRLDFGTSLTSGRSALESVFAALPATLQLAGLAIVVNTLLAIPIGAWLGARPDRPERRVVSGVVSVAQGIPAYVVGLMLIQIFTVQLGLLPSVANASPASSVLPTLTLAFFMMPQLIRVVAASVGEATRQDYVRTALANGAAPRTLLARHALPNGLLATTAMLGAQFAFLLSGSVLTEFIFAWPGLGLLLVDSVTNLNFPVVQAAIFVVATLVFLVNALLDLVFQFADPRLRKGQV